MRTFSILTVTAIAVTLAALASAQPVLEPAPPKRDAPLIGRAQLRGKSIDLTRESVSAGGPAHELGKGTAEVIGDADVYPAAAPSD